MSLVSRLAVFVAELRFEQVPQAVRAKLRHHVLDSLGVICAGLNAPESRAVRDFAAARPGRGEAALIGCGARALAADAAFVNTFHGRIHTFDDTFEAGPVHPGTCVVSAALAAAEACGAPGRRLLEAMLAGYEVSIRVCAAAGPGHYAAGFHPTGTCNAFGAAAAAAHAYGLDAQQTAAALALAGEAAAGLRQHQDDGSMANSALNGARAARAGVEAAQLARAGLAGPEQILEGRFGFFRMLAGSGEHQVITRGLGTHYRFLETSLKPYPTCRFTHGPIAALHALARAEGLRAADIESIELATFRQSVEVSDRPKIRTRSEAILSHQYALALALTRERITLGDLDEAVRTHADLHALSARVRVVHDPRLDAQYPACWPHRLSVSSKRHGILRAESDFPPGGPQDPLGEEAVVAKFHALADPVLGSSLAAQVRTALWALESAPDVKGLTGHS
jgi:2-methylcitrate dehydratase PrpD